MVFIQPDSITIPFELGDAPFKNMPSKRRIHPYPLENKERNEISSCGDCANALFFKLFFKAHNFEEK